MATTLKLAFMVSGCENTCTGAALVLNVVVSNFEVLTGDFLNGHFFKVRVKGDSKMVVEVLILVEVTDNFEVEAGNVETAAVIVRMVLTVGLLVLVVAADFFFFLVVLLIFFLVVVLNVVVVVFG